MTRIIVKLTANELELLSSLASDQLFRREFIDPKLPGYRAKPGELSLGKQLLMRLRAVADRARHMPPDRRNGTTSVNSPRTAGFGRAQDAL